MDQKLASDLFCSLLIAHHIMTGKQISKIVTLKKLSSLRDLWEGKEEYLNEDSLTADQFNTWKKFRESPVFLRFDEYVEYVSSHGIHSIDRLDDDYPSYMRPLPNMPLILYYKGDLSLLSKDRSRVCIVGTRRPSSYGKRVTRDFSGKLSRHDLVIVSGLARGVDTIAHEACLENGGKTIAVMPCGLDKIYPKENRELFEKIGKDGLLLSELLPGQEPIRQYFPARNRILSAISDCVLIPEAGKQSGTLHTASFAGAQGKEVFVVPSIIYSETAEGNLMLLKDGASAATEPEDILAFLAHVVFFREIEEIKENYDRKNLEKKIKDSPESLTAEEIRRILIEILSVSEATSDEIVKETGLPYRMVVSELGKMEVEGYIHLDRRKYVLTIRV